MERDDDLISECGDSFPRARRDRLGFDYCLGCSPAVPKVANMPQHKQAYSYTTNLDLLKENCYATHK